LWKKEHKIARLKTKEDLLIEELLKDYSDPKQILGDTQRYGAAEAAAKEVGRAYSV
jgi:hypothetical protein